MIKCQREEKAGQKSNCPSQTHWHRFQQTFQFKFEIFNSAKKKIIMLVELISNIYFFYLSFSMLNLSLNL